MGDPPPPTWVLLQTFSMAGQCWDSRTSSSSSRSIAAGFVRCWRWRLPFLHADARYCICLVAFLQWWSAWCRGWNDPSTDHGSHGQRKTYVIPSGHLKFLHSVVARSCWSFRGATARLNPVAKILWNDEEMVAANQLAQSGTCGKIPVDPSPYSRYTLVLLE